MYLHEDKELFQEVIVAASDFLHEDIAVVEKDYYVTMILKLLSEMLDNVVFKGGTSLSKGYHVINRFSEDIDITFDTHIGESRRKKLKYNVMKVISEKLNMPITNWDAIESDKDYNYYLFSYDPINHMVDHSILPGVKVETALASYAFPTEEHAIDNYARQFLDNENQELVAEYGLEKFTMKLQSLKRTYIDKVFALCDYYLEGKSKRYSRHLYDIFKLQTIVDNDDELKALVKEVRSHRAKMKICPSAKAGVDIKEIVKEFLDSNFYKEDYENITNYFVTDYVAYDDACVALRTLVESGTFDTYAVRS